MTELSESKLLVLMRASLFFDVIKDYSMFICLDEGLYNHRHDWLSMDQAFWKNISENLEFSREHLPSSMFYFVSTATGDIVLGIFEIFRKATLKSTRVFWKLVPSH